MLDNDEEFSFRLNSFKKLITFYFLKLRNSHDFLVSSQLRFFAIYLMFSFYACNYLILNCIHLLSSNVT